VPARGKKFNALCSGPGKNIEKTGVQAAAQKYMRRDDLQHR
jgi:hypothetical protein